MKRGRRVSWKDTFLVLVVILLGIGATCGAASTSDAADWLQAQQNVAGWFPWTPGGGATTNTQGPSGMGILSAYMHTKTSGYLLSATDNGDYMLDPMWVSLSIYGDGDPRFATHDPLFMEALSLTTSDPQYADFVQANFWDKLTAGTYGSSNDLDAAGFGAAVVNGRAGQGIVELSPWDLSATAIAAHMAGEFAIRDALMGAILAGLERTLSAGVYDVTGLAGAVWASAMTGIDLDPTVGMYAGNDSTADLAATLAGLTLTGNDGAWIWNSTLDPTDPGNADTQTTAFAIAALYAFDNATYIGQIARGVAFIRSLQQTDGQFLSWPGAPLNSVGSVEVNAEAISAIVFVAPPTVYVDGDFAVLGLGDDPAGPGVAVGYDAFGAIQDGVDEVMLGGTVEVAGKNYYMSGLGEYDENVIIYRPVTLVGTSYPAINPSSGAAIMLRSPGGVPLVGVVIDGIDSFSGAYGILLDEDMFAHLGEELDVRDLTISGSPWYFSHTAEGIAILNGTYVSNMLLDDVWMDDNNVGLGISGAGTEVNDLTMLYGSVSHNNNHGLLILSGATVNDLLVLGAEVVGNSNEGVHVNSATLNRAQIDGCLVIDNNGMGLWFQNATVSDLAVLDTLIEGNGESGMALHSGTYSGVLIEGCTFSDNGWEHLDLGLWGGSPTLDDIQIIRNVFDSGAEWAAIYIDGGTSFDPDDVHIHYNAFTLGDWAIGNSSGNTVDASLNWWGDGEGPSTGAPIWGSVVYSPWLGIDPDGDPGTVGVQIAGPMLIIVAPVGPEPASGYLNAAIAGANSAYLPGTDTIEVRHGTYDASEPITQAVNIASEIGSASHTTLNGNMSINGNGVLIGLPLQGFRVNGNLTVGAGANAATSRINWCDFYGLMTNNGTGAFDARYNYWGTKEMSVIQARTTGAIRIQPYLPKGADESYIDIVAILNAGAAPNLTAGIHQLWRMDRMGLDVGTFIQYQGVAGAGALRATAPGAQINLGGAAGGGGAVEGVVSGTYTIGTPIDGRFILTDPVTGEPITDAAVTLSLLGPDGSKELAFWGCASYDETTGEYVYSIDTSGLAPGTYELIIQTDDGQSKVVSIEIQVA